jgi:hypothetical protein
MRLCVGRVFLHTNYVGKQILLFLLEPPFIPPSFSPLTLLSGFDWLLFLLLSFVYLSTAH